MCIGDIDFKGQLGYLWSIIIRVGCMIKKKAGIQCVCKKNVLFSYSFVAGLSLRAGSRAFSPASKSVASGYFYWKIEEN